MGAPKQIYWKVYICTFVRQCLHPVDICTCVCMQAYTTWWTSASRASTTTSHAALGTPTSMLPWATLSGLASTCTPTAVLPQQFGWLFASGTYKYYDKYSTTGTNVSFFHHYCCCLTVSAIYISLLRAHESESLASPVCVCIYTYLYTHIYIYINIHIYICIYIYGYASIHHII